jgi:NAD(P)-dependent dehydrogenase (short-subunit alcohol dehydrogenase family)
MNKNNGQNFWKYFKEYKWSNVYSMIKNNRKDPKTCNTKSEGKLILITGGTSGIGYLVVKKYASMGADILCINRNLEKSKALKQEIEDKYKVSCDYLIADLSSIEQTHKVCDKILEFKRPIDIIIHNAGVFLTKREITDDGIEKVFMVHYLSSFIITYRLRKRLISQENSRIIIINSEGHRFAAWGLRLDDLNWDKRHYSGLKSYGSAKLAQLLSMICFDEDFSQTNVTINAMHPGAVKTETGQENGKIYKWYKRNILDKTLKPASISAEAIYFLGISEDVKNESGNFYNLTTIEEPTPPALDKEVARLLWEKSISMAKLHEYEN